MLEQIPYKYYKHEVNGQPYWEAGTSIPQGLVNPQELNFNQWVQEQKAYKMPTGETAYDWGLKQYQATGGPNPYTMGASTGYIINPTTGNPQQESNYQQEQELQKKLASGEYINVGTASAPKLIPKGSPAEANLANQIQTYNQGKFYTWDAYHKTINEQAYDPFSYQNAKERDILATPQEYISLNNAEAAKYVSNFILSSAEQNKMSDAQPGVAGSVISRAADYLLAHPEELQKYRGKINPKLSQSKMVGNIVPDTPDFMTELPKAPVVEGKSGQPVSAAGTQENLRKLGPTEFTGLNKDWEKAGLTPAEVEKNFITRKGTDIYLKTDAPSSEQVISQRPGALLKPSDIAAGTKISEQDIIRVGQDIYLKPESISKAAPERQTELQTQLTLQQKPGVPPQTPPGGTPAGGAPPPVGGVPPSAGGTQPFASQKPSERLGAADILDYVFNIPKAGVAERGQIEAVPIQLPEVSQISGQVAGLMPKPSETINTTTALANKFGEMSSRHGLQLPEVSAPQGLGALPTLGGGQPMQPWYAGAQAGKMTAGPTGLKWGQTNAPKAAPAAQPSAPPVQITPQGQVSAAPKAAEISQATNINYAPAEQNVMQGALDSEEFKYLQEKLNLDKQNIQDKSRFTTEYLDRKFGQDKTILEENLAQSGLTFSGIRATQVRSLAVELAAKQAQIDTETASKLMDLDMDYKKGVLGLVEETVKRAQAQEKDAIAQMNKAGMAVINGQVVPTMEANKFQEDIRQFDVSTDLKRQNLFLDIGKHNEDIRQFNQTLQFNISKELTRAEETARTYGLDVAKESRLTQEAIDNMQFKILQEVRIAEDARNRLQLDIAKLAKESLQSDRDYQFDVMKEANRAMENAQALQFDISKEARIAEDNARRLGLDISKEINESLEKSDQLLFKIAQENRILLNTIEDNEFNRIKEEFDQAQDLRTYERSLNQLELDIVEHNLNVDKFLASDKGTTNKGTASGGVVGGGTKSGGTTTPAPGYNPVTNKTVLSPDQEALARNYALNGESIGNVGLAKGKILQRAEEIKMEEFVKEASSNPNMLVAMIDEALAANGGNYNEVRADMLAAGIPKELYQEALKRRLDALQTGEAEEGFFSKLFSNFSATPTAGIYGPIANSTPYIILTK